MRPLFLILTLAMATVSRGAQAPVSGPALASVLRFEADRNGTMPRGWSGGPTETIALDGEIIHSGRGAVRIERGTASANGFSSLTLVLPIDFTGNRIELRGFLKTENVSDFTGLWMREDGNVPSLAFDNMQNRQVKGTNDWTQYSIVLPLHAQARQLFFGVLIAGTGKAWADDLELLVDGKPIWDAPKIVRATTVLDTDHEFDSGSRVVLSELTKVQIDNLALLGKVWGFLKYHHQGVVAGKYHWDYELFRVLPRVVEAKDRADATAVLFGWIRGLGPVPSCTACITPAVDSAHLLPDLKWISDDSLLGRDLGELMRTIHRQRSRATQFYVSMANVGNPVFQNESAYPAIRFPDAGYQLLTLYRFWNIVQYWYPNRNILDEDWDKVLADFIPRLALARDRDAYQLEALALIGKITDTHANLNVPPTVRPPAGVCQLPVVTRFVEDRAVVTGYSTGIAAATGVRVGDVIEELDGTPVSTLIERWAPYFPASNRQVQLHDMSRVLTRGACAPVRLRIRRETEALDITTARVPQASVDFNVGRTHDLRGETFRLLSEDVAYLKLSSVKAAEAPSYVNRAAGTRGLIVDIRNYPSEFVVFALGSLFVDKPTEFVQFTAGVLDNPGAFTWKSPPILQPQAPRYGGKIVILVDETSLSQAEYTAMAFRSAPNAIVVGSTTAGADGNVSPIPIPGGLSTLISGLGVFHADKRPTQRVGIVPDVEVRPTIAGVRAGRDEVLEEAIRQILGREVPADRIQQLARP